MILSVHHLVDDANVGGINRGLDLITRCPDLARVATHAVTRVRRGQFRAPKLAADIIVSHLSVCWANLPLFTALRAAYPNVPIVHVEHSYSESFVALHVTRRDRFDTLVATAFSLFGRIVAVSDAQARWMVRKSYCTADRLTVIESCADLTSFLAVPDRPRAGRLVIGAVGRFDAQKGFDILIDAFRRTQIDAELHLYGLGADEGRLRARAAGHPDIRFRGFADNVADAMANCDVVAMPSRWEPLGIVAVEALAAGRPVLASRVDGLTTHGRGGAVFAAENTPEGWTTLLDALDMLDLPALARRGRIYGLEARARFAPAWNGLIRSLADAPAELRRAA